MRKLLSIQALLAMILLAVVIVAPSASAGMNTGGGNWSWSNPSPQGNTINSVSFINASTGWAAGSGGVVIKTADGGANWSNQTPSTSCLGVSGSGCNLNGVTFIDANNGWAVGDYGSIYHTADGGATWNPQSLPTPYTQYPLNAIAFTSATSGIALSSGSCSNVGGVWKCNGYAFYTNDAGAHWTASGQITGTASGPVNNLSLYSLYMISGTTGYAVGDQGAIYKTTNGGINWSVVGPPGGTSTSTFMGIFFADANNGYIVGKAASGAGVVLRTSNGGSTWTANSTAIATPLDALRTTGGAVVAVGAGGAIYRGADSTDVNTLAANLAAGPVASGTTSELRALTYPGGGASGFAGGAAGAIAKTADNGASWSLTAGGNAVSIYGSSFLDANTGWEAGNNGMVLKTADGGASWTSDNTGIPADVSLRGIQFLNASTGFAVGFQGTYNHDTGTGVAYKYSSGTWSAISLPGSPTYISAVHMTSATSGWMAGLGGKIYRTSDGSTWSLDNTGVAGNFDINAVDATNAASDGWAVGQQVIPSASRAAGTVTVSGGQVTGVTITNGGSGYTFPPHVTFTDVNGGTGSGAAGTATVSGGQVTGVTITNGGSGYSSGATVSFTDSAVLLKYSGGSWTAQSKTPVGNFFLDSIDMVDASNGFTAGSQGIVYKTTDGGTNWTQQSTGSTKLLAGIAFFDTSTGFVAGQDGRVLKTIDGGANWTIEPVGTNISFYTLTLASSPAHVAYAGGGNAAVLKYSTAPVVSNLTPSGWQTADSPTLQAHLSDTSGNGMNTATVSVTLDGSPLAGCSVTGGSTSADVSCPTSGLSKGSHTYQVSVQQNTTGDTGIGFGSFGVELGYYWTWYDQATPGTGDWILAANPAGAAQSAWFDLWIGGQKQTLAPLPGRQPGEVPPGTTAFYSFPNLMNGPVDLGSRGSATGKAITSQRSVWGSSLEEIPGTEQGQLSDHFYWTWYDQGSPGMYDWVLVSNPSTTDTVTAEISFTDYSDPAHPAPVDQTYDIPAGQKVTPWFPGKIGGPVEVKAWLQGSNWATSPRNVIASQRVLSNGGSAFNEVPGIPASKLSDRYLWTWYDQASLNALNWVLVANPASENNNQTVTCEITFTNKADGATIDSGPIDIAPGQKVTPQFPAKQGGPVEVKAWLKGQPGTPAKVIASQRVVWGPSFEEKPGQPASTSGGVTTLNSTYYWTWYDFKSPGFQGDWVLVANPDNPSAYYEITMGNNPTPVKTGTISQGQSDTPFFTGAIGGPVKVQAWTDSGKGTPVNVISSQRVLYNGYFNELEGQSLN